MPRSAAYLLPATLAAAVPAACLGWMFDPGMAKIKLDIVQ
jgi:hypothetical protein